MVDYSSQDVRCLLHHIHNILNKLIRHPAQEPAHVLHINSLKLGYRNKGGIRRKKYAFEISRVVNLNSVYKGTIQLDGRASY